jgi:hypothetical protein
MFAVTQFVSLFRRAGEICVIVWFALHSVPAFGADQPTVSVLYAGSLATVMENGVGPPFVKATGYGYQGEAQGSLGGAQMIRDRLRTPDVFISADPLVNLQVLMGPQNGSMVKWFTILASSQLVPPTALEVSSFQNFRTPPPAVSHGMKCLKLLGCDLAAAIPALILRDIARSFFSALPENTMAVKTFLNCWEIQ